MHAMPFMCESISGASRCLCFRARKQHTTLLWSLSSKTCCLGLLGREEGEEKALRQETIQDSVNQTRVQASLCSAAQFLHPFMTCE
jgi:hypothetical protein